MDQPPAAEPDPAAALSTSGHTDYTGRAVDALTTLLMVLIFLLSIFSVAQFTIQHPVLRDTAIDSLGRQSATSPSSFRSRRSPPRPDQDVAVPLQSQLAPSATVNTDLAAQRKTTDNLKAEADRLRPLKDATREIETATTDYQKELERQRAESRARPPAA